MTSEHTPTTDEVRSDYADHRDRCMYSPTIKKARQFRESGGGGGEFDRWLAEHEAALIEKLADEIRPNIKITMVQSSDQDPSASFVTASALLRRTADWLCSRAQERREQA